MEGGWRRLIMNPKSITKRLHPFAFMLLAGASILPLRGDDSSNAVSAVVSKDQGGSNDRPAAPSLAVPGVNQAPVPPSTPDPSHWGDQGDGSYVNPVLPADYSDIDVIRVGDDFYAISSTFQFSPGVVILKSRDLVNWRTVGHAVPDVRQIGPEMNWDRMNRYGNGVWAGAIRHHDGRFWVYFGTPDEGYFMTSAPSAEGPWEPLTNILKGRGWDDCCPFWDDDGQGYLVGSNFSKDPANGKKYNIHLWKLTPDGKGLVEGSDRIIHQSTGSEANKLYKINGTYYHYYSEVRPEGRVVMMNRSKSLEGPWETRQLNHSSKGIDPNQGGLVELPDKSWWFFTHFGTGDWAGRKANLLPVNWVDGWPILGNPAPDGIGTMVWNGKKPIAGSTPTPRSFQDDFTATKLSPDWEWNYHPRDDKWSLSERPGFLRLHAFPPLKKGNLLGTCNILTTRIYQSGRGEATIRLDLSGMVDGQSAGLCLLARRPAWIGVTRAGGVNRIAQGETGPGARGEIQGPEIPGKDLWLRVTISSSGSASWFYSSNGTDFVAFGKNFQCNWGYYRGTRLGIFTSNEGGESGWIDVKHFGYLY